MKWLKDYFDLSRKEQAGFVALLGIMAILFALQFFMVYFVPEHKTDFSYLQKIAQQLQTGNIDSAKIKDITGPKKALTVPVDLNKADSIKLMTIKGVGPAFAGRILAFRRRLGCFVNIEQLMDIHGIGTEKFKYLQPQVLVTKGHPRYLHLNSAAVDDLTSNPYCSYAMANSIIDYRKKNGKFNSVEGLKKVSIIDENTFQKLKPYIAL